MPPILAAFLTLGFLAVLFAWEARNNRRMDAALWLPVLWLTVTGSRFFSQWLEIFGVNVGVPGNDGDGSPIDALYFLTLIVLGIVVLVRRRVSVVKFISDNRWLSALLIYALISIAWSDFPFISFKRWIKIIGHPVMALIIVTHRVPADALRAVLKRCAFILVPVSILFIKYYPEFGRMFDPFTGAGFNVGVATQKNGLGYICMVFGIFFLWNFISVRKMRNVRNRRQEMWISIAFILMILWLLKLSDSVTSLAMLLFGGGVVLALGMPLLNRRMIAGYIVGGIAVALGAELTFGVYEAMVEALGRDATLTDRTLIWEDVLALQSNPIFGVGFESFWLGSRLDVLWDEWWWRPTQAHNGYIEIYLNLGLVGLLLLLGTILAAFFRISRSMVTDFDWARLRMAYLLAICVYNYTEAAFTAVHFVWTMFFIISIRYPQRTASAVRLSSRPATSTGADRRPPPLGEPARAPSPQAGARLP
jgi:exopolysaccharide production protein ExoQ